MYAHFINVSYSMFAYMWTGIRNGPTLKLLLCERKKSNFIDFMYLSKKMSAVKLSFAQPECTHRVMLVGALAH